MTGTSIHWNRVTFESQVIYVRVFFGAHIDKTWDTRQDEEFTPQSVVNQVTAAPGEWGCFALECGGIM